MFEAETILARGRAMAEALEIAPAHAGTEGRERPAADAGTEGREERPAGEPFELTLIDAVVAACELSEDETEVRDLVDAIVQRPDVRVVAESRPPTRARPARRIRHKAA